MAVDRALWERFRAAGRERELIERELGLHWEDLRFPVQAINPPGAESDIHYQVDSRGSDEETSK
jgi:hypothetical protein